MMNQQPEIYCDDLEDLYLTLQLSSNTPTKVTSGIGRHRGYNKYFITLMSGFIPYSIEVNEYLYYLLFDENECNVVDKKIHLSITETLSLLNSVLRTQKINNLGI